MKKVAERRKNHHLRQIEKLEYERLRAIALGQPVPATKPDPLFENDDLMNREEKKTEGEMIFEQLRHIKKHKDQSTIIKEIFRILDSYFYPDKKPASPAKDSTATLKSTFGKNNSYEFDTSVNKSGSSSARRKESFAHKRSSSFNREMIPSDLL
jgi:hypothetical protein